MLLVIVGAAFTLMTRRIDAERRFLMEGLEPAEQYVTQFQLSFLDEVAVGRAYVIAPTDALMGQFLAHGARTHSALDTLTAQAARIAPEVTRDVGELSRLLSAWEVLPRAYLSGKVSLRDYGALVLRQTALANALVAQAAHVDRLIARLRHQRRTRLQALERDRLVTLASLFPLALVGIALTAWFARNAARSHQRILHNAEYEAVLRDTMAALTGAEILPATLNRIATNAMHAGEADGAFLEAADDERANVTVVASAGIGAPTSGARFPFSESITAELVRAGRPVIIVDLLAHAGDLTRMLGLQWAHRYGVGVALQDQGSVTGALVLLRREPLDLNSETVTRLQDLAGWAPLALRRQKLAAQLETEHARLEAVIDEMPLAVVLAEAPSGRVAMFNRHAVELWGRSPRPPVNKEEYIDWPLLRLDGRPYDLRERPLVRTILTGETVHGEEAEIEHGDGTRRTVLINTAPVHDASHIIVAGVAVITDISQEKHREEGTRFLDEVSRQLAATLDYESTTKAVIQLMVPRMGDFVSLFHRQDDDTIRRTAAATSDSRLHRLIQEIDSEYPMPLPSTHPVPVAIRTGKAQLRETVDDEQLREIAKDERQLRWLRSLGVQSVMAVPLVVHGKTIGALQIGSVTPSHHYTCDDLTFAEEIGRRVAMAVDNAQLHRTVAEAGRITQFLAESTPFLSASLDYDEVLRRVTRLAVPFFADFTIAYVKDATGRAQPVATAHRDQSKEPLVAELARLYRPEPTDMESSVARALQTGQPVLLEHVTSEVLDRKHLEPRARELFDTLSPTSWVTVPLVARDEALGAIVFVSTNPDRPYTPDDVGLGQTIASRVALAVQNALLYRDAQRALATRDEVLRIVSHDLRNPLNTIGMGVQLLADPDVADDERRKHLELIGRSRERMERLIQDLRDVNRLEAGKALAFELGRERPAALVQEACESFVEPARDKRVLLKWRVPDGVPDVQVDHGRIIQVLSNLIGNALKFTPEGGRVSVRADADEGNVLVSVEDTGPGIPTDDLDKVFRTFWQASQVAHLGAGLGLPISRGIVEQHGGRIWVESQEGVGSKFCFTLPPADRPSASRAPFADRRRARSRERRTGA